MSLSIHEQRLLRRIDELVRCSDPHLASMLMVFNRLSAGEPIPGREQLQALDRNRKIVAAVLLAAVSALALLTRAAGMCARVLARSAPRLRITARVRARAGSREHQPAEPKTPPRSTFGGCAN
ncbi:MAG: DUF3040 domain-containing protein [Streptosporangiaceae bacterium]